MKEVEEKILACGKVLPGDVLKVDSFLNHQIDVSVMALAGREFHRLFADEGVTKILTIEASGIGIACLTAEQFGVPVLFAKKSRGTNASADFYAAKVASYTHNTTYDVSVSKEFLNAGDRILIIDDFLALGNALRGLIDLAHQAGATVVGCGIVVEKAYQCGGDDLRNAGVRVESLAKIATMDPDAGITFC